MSSRKLLVTKSSAPKKITNIQFGTLLTEEIEKIAEFQISSPDLVQHNRVAAPNGCLDPRLGISDKRSLCKTCKYVFLNIFNAFYFILLIHRILY